MTAALAVLVPAVVVAVVGAVALRAVAALAVLLVVERRLRVARDVLTRELGAGVDRGDDGDLTGVDPLAVLLLLEGEGQLGGCLLYTSDAADE